MPLKKNKHPNFNTHQDFFGKNTQLYPGCKLWSYVFKSAASFPSLYGVRFNSSKSKFQFAVLFTAIWSWKAVFYVWMFFFVPGCLAVNQAHKLRCIKTDTSMILSSLDGLWLPPKSILGRAELNQELYLTLTWISPLSHLSSFGSPISMEASHSSCVIKHDARGSRR